MRDELAWHGNYLSRYQHLTWGQFGQRGADSQSVQMRLNGSPEMRTT